MTVLPSCDFKVIPLFADILLFELSVFPPRYVSLTLSFATYFFIWALVSNV